MYYTANIGLSLAMSQIFLPTVGFHAFSIGPLRGTSPKDDRANLGTPMRNPFCSTFGIGNWSEAAKDARAWARMAEDFFDYVSA